MGTTGLNSFGTMSRFCLGCEAAAGTGFVAFVLGVAAVSKRTSAIRWMFSWGVLAGFSSDLISMNFVFALGLA